MSVCSRWAVRVGFLSALAMLGVICATLSGCASTQMFMEPNGTVAYHAKCTLWFQCKDEAKEMCPQGYELVNGPHRRRPTLPNGTPVSGPIHMDFACDSDTQ